MRSVDSTDLGTGPDGSTGPISRHQGAQPAAAALAAPPERAEIEEVQRVASDVMASMATIIEGKSEALLTAVTVLLAEGHLLIEDVPGVGKTMLAKALARSVDCRFSRLQFTPDLLPSDVTGVSVYDQRTNDFDFRPGPVFTNLLLVDEVNRASPKTQAALLECMQERQVTVDGVTHPLAAPFMVIATQNPIEYEGTYPLPEAQLDRFMMLLHLGYPDAAEEARMLAEQASAEPLSALDPVCTVEEVRAAAQVARELYVEESLNRYAVALLQHTRSDPRLALGASPRSGIALLRVAKTRALLEGRDFVIPDDIKDVAVPVLSHRVLLGPEARAAGITGEEIVQEAVDRTPVPL